MDHIRRSASAIARVVEAGLCLFALILWNETVDLWVEQWPDPGQQYGEGTKDVLLTMALPMLLMWAVRVRPDLFRSGGGQARRR